MITIKINGKEYSNVSVVSPSFKYDYDYDVVTLDGKIHRKLKGVRNIYDIVFLNDDLATYDELKSLLLTNATVSLEVSDGAVSTDSGTFYVTVKNSDLRGMILGNQYYHTGLAAIFEKEGYNA